MRHLTKLLRLKANPSWFFRWAIGLLFVIASVFIAMESEFAYTQAQEVGDVVTAGAGNQVGTKSAGENRERHAFAVFSN